MLRKHFYHLQVLYGDSLIAHLAGHTQAFENLSWIRAGADRTRSTETVVLAMSRLANSTKTVALHNALETFTL